MSQIREFSEPAKTLEDVESACIEARRLGYFNTTRVSFRERGGTPHLVLRWEILPCEFVHAGCEEEAARLDEHGAFCRDHGEGNWPDYTDESYEEIVTCALEGCEDESRIKFADGNYCSIAHSEAAVAKVPAPA